MTFWKAIFTLVIEICVIALLIPGSYTQGVIESEAELVMNHAGPETLEFVQTRGIEWSHNIIHETGFFDAALLMLIPSDDEREKSTGLENLGRLWFDYAEARLYALEDLSLLVANRLALAFAWLPYLLILFIPAVLDGYFARRIRQTNFAYASPIFHTYASRFVSVVVIGGLMLFFMPIALSPIIIPASLIFVSIAVGIALGNFQKRV